MNSFKNEDGKIIINNSGEIFKNPPIIDISSDYGVTKDGSNLVSSVINRYQPNVFRAPSGSEPTENGDGFRFDNNKLQGVGWDFSEDYILEFWIKFDANTTYRFLDMANYPADANNYFSMLLKSSPFGGYTIEVNINTGTGIAGIRRGTVTIPVSLNTWTHYYATYTNGIYTEFNGGVIGQVISDLNVPKSAVKYHCHIGVLDTLNPLYGNFNKFKVHYDSPKLIGWDGTDLKWEVNEQVFTPPTYPNTIL